MKRYKPFLTSARTVPLTSTLQNAYEALPHKLRIVPMHQVLSLLPPQFQFHCCRTKQTCCDAPWQACSLHFLQSHDVGQSTTLQSKVAPCNVGNDRGQVALLTGTAWSSLNGLRPKAPGPRSFPVGRMTALLTCMYVGALRSQLLYKGCGVNIRVNPPPYRVAPHSVGMTEVQLPC